MSLKGSFKLKTVYFFCYKKCFLKNHIQIKHFLPLGLLRKLNLDQVSKEVYLQTSNVSLVCPEILRTKGFCVSVVKLPWEQCWDFCCYAIARRYRDVQQTQLEAEAAASAQNMKKP